MCIELHKLFHDESHGAIDGNKLGSEIAML